MVHVTAVEVEWFDGFEKGGDVRRLVGSTCCVLRRLEMLPTHRDC
jgi:hypothetical protein